MPWSFPEIPSAGRMSQLSDGRRGNVSLRRGQPFKRTGCHCERSEAISLVGERTRPRLPRRFTPRNDSMQRVTEWLQGGSLQA
jgi:hypothetical protein